MRFYAKIALTIAEITVIAKTLAALVVAAPVPRPLVPEGWGELVVLVKPPIAEFAELMTEEREKKEELTPDGREVGGRDSEVDGRGEDGREEDGTGENPLNVEVAG